MVAIVIILQQRRGEMKGLFFFLTQRVQALCIVCGCHGRRGDLTRTNRSMTWQANFYRLSYLLKTRSCNEKEEGHAKEAVVFPGCGRINFPWKLLLRQLL